MIIVALTLENLENYQALWRNLIRLGRDHFGMHILCQFGCGILKMVGPKMQDFCPRINMHVKNRRNFFKKKSFKNINLGDHFL